MGARPTSFKQEPVVAVPVEEIVEREWSRQQQAIFNWFKGGCPVCGGLAEYEGEYGPKPCMPCIVGDRPQNLVVRARAGTGKTTTIIEGINRAPETSILLTSFSKPIVKELEERVRNDYAEVRTLHSLGFRMVRNMWKGVGVEKEKGDRANALTNIALLPWETEHKEKVPWAIRRSITELHTKGREMVPLGTTQDDLARLAFQFNLVPDEEWGRFDLDFVTLHALAAMHEAASVAPSRKIGIDYADMIYLPLAWNLTSRDFDLVVVDEAPDMNLAQLEIAQRVCRGRMCLVGDNRQAIYGFRGADTGGLDRLKQKLQAVELPLTVTYRCGSEIVKLAQRLVPDFGAAPTNPPGIVDECWEGEVLDKAEVGDFVLSRLNAPLVSLTLNFLRMGKRARMAGRDVGKGVAAILAKLKCNQGTPLPGVMRRLREWERKMVTRAAEHGNADLASKIKDDAGVLYALAADADSMVDLMNRCYYLFTDDPTEPMILCSTVHKAKGLEADRVFVLMDTLYTRGVTPEEVNLEYVAITRAKRHLTLARLKAVDE